MSASGSGVFDEDTMSAQADAGCQTLTTPLPTTQMIVGPIGVKMG